MASRRGSPRRAPSAVHFAAATAAASANMRSGGRPRQMLNNRAPTNASPAPVVSTTAPYGIQPGAP